MSDNPVWYITRKPRTHQLCRREDSVMDYQESVMFIETTRVGCRVLS